MIDRVLNIVLIVLFAVTAIILGLFLFGGNVPDQAYTTPVYTSTLINWAYVLFGIACVVALLFPVVRLATRPKQAMKSFIGVALIAVIILIAYSMSDGTPLKLTGYTGSDNVPASLKFADTMIYTMYILFAGAILAIVGGELYRKFR